MARGYWLRFEGEQNPTIPGISSGATQIQVYEGWNLIGAFDRVISVASISSKPEAIFGDFIGFNPDNIPPYFIAPALEPGRGYWVEISENGVLNLREAETAANGELVQLADLVGEVCGRIIVVDGIGKTAILYLTKEKSDLNRYNVPPLPPVGVFDVRYGSDRYAEHLDQNGVEVKISSGVYPIRLSVEGIDIRVQYNKTGGVQQVVLSDGGEITINNSQINIIKVQAGNSL
jgi:hypothetical protein